MLIRCPICGEAVNSCCRAYHDKEKELIEVKRQLQDWTNAQKLSQTLGFDLTVCTQMIRDMRETHLQERLDKIKNIIETEEKIQDTIGKIYELVGGQLDD